MSDQSELARLIDHTILKSEANIKDILKVVNEALIYKFRSVCVYPFFIPFIRDLLRGSGTAVCTVIAFPHGNSGHHVKTQEALHAVSLGAEEVDMVMNIAAFKSGMHNICENEIRFIKKQLPAKIVLKVIVETALLSEDELRTVARLVMASGADFIKTSTGFASRGASESDIRIIREAVGNGILIKASGGISTPEKARLLIGMGADRLGCSQSLRVIGAE
jgi:deoxyribose-phosphate aldolase